jgi:hypothetical protein
MPRHPDVIITVNTRLSQEFLAETMRGAIPGDKEDPIEDDDGHGDVNANQGLLEIEDEIPMEDMIEAEKEMSSSRAPETTEVSLEVDRMTENQLGSTIDNPVSVSSDSDSLDTYDIPSSPPEEVVPVGKNTAQRKADHKGILDGNQEMECMQPWDSAAEELGYYDHDSENDARWRAVAANVKEVPVSAEFDSPHPSNRRTSRSPVVERIDEVQTVDIASHSESEDGSGSEDGHILTESTNNSSSEVSSSSEISNDMSSGASDNSSQSARAIPDFLDANEQTQSTSPAKSSQKEVEAHKGNVNPFLNAWPNMSKRPQNWHSGMTDSESEESKSSIDSDSEYERVKKTLKPALKQNSALAVRRDKGGTVNDVEWVTDPKSDDAGRKKQNEKTTARTKEEATSEQCKYEIANQFANKRRGGDTVTGTNEKRPTKRKSSKEKGIHNKEKQPTTDQHVHDAVSDNNGRRTFTNHGDKTKEKSSHHVERGKSRARRVRRQRSKNKLAKSQRTT